MRAVHWLLPPALFLAVYWLGLHIWFHTDDFSLLWMVMLPGDEFWPQLLQPRAQGTFRPLSERLYFRLFYEAFGLNAFPYRLFVFATQVVNLWLLTALAKRLSRSWAVAVAAGCLWGVHHGLAVTMSWSSAYNQALFSFFVLLGLHAWARFCDGGGWGWYAAQWAVLLVGFGALEAMVIYPALALAYAALYGKNRWGWVLPLFLLSGALTALQLSARPAAESSIYSISLAPQSLADTFVQYVEWGFVGRIYEDWSSAAWLLGPLLLALAAWEWRRQRPAALFGCVVFLVGIAPYLPLAGHRSDYYLFLPATGLALAAGAVAQTAWRAGWAGRAAWAASVGFCVWTWVVTAQTAVEYSYQTSIRARNLVTGLRYVRQIHPSETVLLTGVDAPFFYASVYHGLFQIADVFDVYLAPDGEAIERLPGFDPIEEFFLPPEQALLGVQRGSIVVYDASGMRLREQTQQYRLQAPARLRGIIE